MAESVLLGPGLQRGFNHRDAVGLGPLKLSGCGLVLFVLEDDVLDFGVELGLLDALVEPRFLDGDVEFRHLFAVFQGVDDELDALAATLAVAPVEFLDLRAQTFADFDDAGGHGLRVFIEGHERSPDLPFDVLPSRIQPFRNLPARRLRDGFLHGPEDG